MSEQPLALLRRQRALIAFFLGYYVVLGAYGAAQGNNQTLFYVLFVGGGAALVAWMHSKHGLSALVLWGLALWGCAHMIGGLFEVDGRVVYELSLGGGQARFDKVVHFFGFGMATLAAYEIVRRVGGERVPAPSIALIAAFIGLGVGAVNETVEFLITLLPGDSNVGGFSNTGWDLVANSLGAATAALLAPRLESARPGADDGPRNGSPI